jgi:RES domain-containing protein
VKVIRQAAATHWRVADPSWGDPFDGSYSMAAGQRWNPRGSFPAIYLNDDRQTAQANARHILRRVDHFFGVMETDLVPSELPVMYPCKVCECSVLDVVSDAGCTSVGLPVTYPPDAQGTVISHDQCQPIGTAAHSAQLDGITARSAAPGGNTELVWFPDIAGPLAASGPPERAISDEPTR